MILRPIESFFQANPSFQITFSDERAVATVNRFTEYTSFGSFSAGIDSGSIRFTKCVGSVWSNVSLQFSDSVLAYVEGSFRASVYNAGAFWTAYPVFPDTTLQSYLRYGFSGGQPPRRFPNNFSYVFIFPKERPVQLRMFNSCIDLRIFPIAGWSEFLGALDSAVDSIIKTGKDRQ